MCTRSISPLRARYTRGLDRIRGSSRTCLDTTYSTCHRGRWRSAMTLPWRTRWRAAGPGCWKKIEEANNDRIERRRRREEQSSDGTIGDEEVDHRVAEERLFPNNIGNWRIDRGRGYFPSLFALQFQKMTTGENDGRQPITHIQQQYRLSRAVYALGFLLFACLIFF